MLVLLEVEPVERLAVAREELAQPAAVGREARSDQPVPGAEPDEDRTALEEGAEDDRRELLVVGDDAAQPLRIDLDHLPRVAHDGGEVDGAAGEQVELAEEAVMPVDCDDAVLAPVALD